MVIRSTPVATPPISNDESSGNHPEGEEFKNIAARLISDKLEFEQTASIISDPAVLKSTDAFLNSILHQKSALKNPKSRIQTRVLLSAFIIVKHPEVLNCESHDIRKQSETILSLLSAFLGNRCEKSKEKFSVGFDGFLVSFDRWKREDAAALQTDLKREVESAESLREAIMKESKEVQADWIPELNGLKSQVTSMVDKLSRLNTKSIFDAGHPSNAQIVHDLFIDGPAKFDYFSLYMPHHKELLLKQVESLKNEPTSESVFDAIVSVKKSLLGLVPEEGKTYKLIDEVLDLGLVRASVSIGQYTDTLQFIIDMMANLCAPIRDTQINKLRQNETPPLTLAGIVELTSTLCSDKIMFDIAKVMPRLPELIVQYERDAFAAEYTAVPMTESACKKVYKYPGMDGKALAAELFSLALTGNLKIEVLWLDGKGIARYSEEINKIAVMASERLTSKKITSDDPTFALIKKRISEHVRQSVLPGEELKSPRIDATLSADEMKILSSLESEIVHLFEFHFKVYQPVYAHLSKNFQ